MISRRQEELRPGAGRARKLSLRLVLVVPFMLQLVAAVGLTGWLSIRHGRQAVDTVTTRLRDELTRHIREYLKGYLETPHLINELSADAISLGHLDWRDPEALLRHCWHQLERFETAAFVFFGSSLGGAAGAGRHADGSTTVDHTDFDSERGLLAGTRYEYRAGPGGGRGELLKADPGFDARKRPWFEAAAAAERPVWSDVYPLFAEQALAIAASRPVYDREGTLLGVLGVDLRLAGIDDFLRRLEIGETGQTFILERSGELVATSIGEAPLIAGASGRGPERLPAAASAESLIGGTTWFLIERFGTLAAIDEDQQLIYDLAGERQFVQVVPLSDGRGLDWLIVIVVPEADFMGPIAANRRRTIQLCLAALVVTTVLGLWTSRWIARPILRLNDASHAIAGGRLDQKVEVEGVEELGDLARSFNRMAAQLKDSFAELERRVEQRTAEYRKARDAADAANRAKSRFLANISHEIRTPLAAMLGYVELLWDRPETAGVAREYLRTIRTNGGHLNQLLSDLLDVSRIEAGRMELDVRPCELDELLANLGSAFEPQARERGLELCIVTDAWLPWQFSGDAMRIQQILSNLLSNAIKYTEKGRVTLAVESDSEAPGESGGELSVSAGAEPREARLTFLVEDTGIGISDRDQRRLFRRFSQLDTSGRATGFGLGLSIVKQLTELMAGTVTVDSAEGRGSKFAVRLPVAGCGGWARARWETQRLPAATLLSELPALAGSVLIADDSESLRLLCRRMLQRWGLECETVGDGGEAVERARARRFDVVLMDWHMPGMDGLEATAELRRLGVETRILALTAAAMSGDREKCLAAGCDGYLVKPIDFKELHRWLALVLQPAPDGGAAGSASAAAGDEQLAELVRGFILGLPDKVAGLARACDAADWPAFDAGVHKLVGTAGSYGLSEIFHAAEELEKIGQRRDASAAPPVLERMAQAVSRAVESVQPAAGGTPS